jgi:ATP-binding cassette subfamily C protein
MKAVKPAPDVLIRDLQRSFFGGLGYAALLSLCVNLLLLTVPLFMMQVQDRVTVSHSYDTLTMLLVIAVGALLLYGTIEFIRSLTFQAMASIFARRLNLPALQAAVSASLEQGSGQATQAIRDLNDIRFFIASSAIATPLEAAWSPIFLAVLFLLHPIYGLVGLASLIILLLLGVLSDMLTRRVLKEANEAGVASINEVGASLRHAETIEAMGMLPALARRWRGQQLAMIEQLDMGTRRGKLIAAVTRASRMTMQLSIYATGAVLIIRNEVTAGTLMAASILLGRLLAPFDSMITDWRQWVLAATAWKRVRELVLSRRSQRQSVPTPPCQGDLVVDRAIYAPPGSEQTVIKGVSFSLEPGEVLGVVGPSGAGKSTLARLFTLGLTETWLDAETGLAMNAHPGPAWLQRMPERFRFVDYGYDATLADMLEIIGLIREHCHPDMRFVVTVSPVPFGATFKDADVIVANSASKSVLRAVAEELFRRFDCVDYFPSYEIVLNSPRAIAFQDDQLHIARDMVGHVMTIFQNAYLAPQERSEAA